MQTHFLIFLFVSFIFAFKVISADETQQKPKEEDPKQIEILNLNKKSSYLINIEEYEEASTNIKKSLSLDLKNQHTLHLSTTLSVRLEKFDEAVESIKMAFPGANSRQFFILAEECLKVSPASKKLREQAVIWAKKSQESAKKKDRWNSYLLASAYFRNNELDLALEEINPLIIKETNDNSFNILIANIHTKKGDYTLATTHLKKAIKKDPIEANIKNHIAYQLISYDDSNENRPAEALPLAIEASTLSKQSSGDIEETLALAYFLNKDLLKAIEAQERAIKLLTAELPENLRGRSSKLQGFKKQLIKYKGILEKFKN